MNNTDPQASIVILMPYFGSWPFWMELFLASCRKNPSIDWYFFSDCGKLDSFPGNVKYQEMSFEEYKTLVSERLGINYNPENAYKICDVRPAFGVIHEDILCGYDFFGFGDLDLVYDDLRKLYTREDLQKYDLISNHATRVSGHLSLFRNTDKMRNAFRKIPGWEDKFTSERHLAVDEKAFSKLFVKHKNLPGFLRRLLNTCYPLARKSKFIESYTTPNGYIAWRDGSDKFPQKWFWNNGLVSNDLDPQGYYYPYFHFAVWKKSDWVGKDLPKIDKASPDSTYVFSSAGIHEVRKHEKD